MNEVELDATDNLSSGERENTADVTPDERAIDGAARDAKRAEREARIRAENDRLLNRVSQMCVMNAVPVHGFLNYLAAFGRLRDLEEDFVDGVFRAYYSDYVAHNAARLVPGANLDGEPVINGVPLAKSDFDFTKLDDLGMRLNTPGCHVVVAQTARGKSTLVRLFNESNTGVADNIAIFSTQEPESATIHGLAGFCSREFSDIIRDPAKAVVVIDSVKETFRLSEPQHPTMQGGIESWFLAMLSRLSAVGTISNRAFVLVLNPLFLDEDTVETLKNDIRGSATNVITLDGATHFKDGTYFVEANYSHRAGDRDFVRVIATSGRGHATEEAAKRAVKKGGEGTGEGTESGNTIVSVPIKLKQTLKA